MKKFPIIFFLLLPAMASYAYVPNEKVLKAFTETFTHAENVKWEEHPGYYSVSFKTGVIQSKVLYDEEGMLLGAIRYYLPDMLPLHILAAVRKQFKKQQLFCVTEVTRNNLLAYFIKLEDDTHWYSISVTSTGNTSLLEKYKKG